MIDTVYRTVYSARMEVKNSKKVILNCALTLFAEKGYNAISVNKIVAMANITKPTLYYFFGNKEGLFREVLKTQHQVLYSELQEVGCYMPHPEEYRRDVFPALLTVAKTYFRFAQDNPEFYCLLLAFSFAPPTSQSAIMSEPLLKKQYKLMTDVFQTISKTHTHLKTKETAASGRFLTMGNVQIGFGFVGIAQFVKKTRKKLHTYFAWDFCLVYFFAH